MLIISKTKVISSVNNLRTPGFFMLFLQVKIKTENGPKTLTYLLKNRKLHRSTKYFKTYTRYQ